MYKLNNIKVKKLKEAYNFYDQVYKKCSKLSKLVFKEKNNDILKQMLYNLVINLCNQIIYNYKYTFTSDDLFFIAEYNINICKILQEFREDILIMKKSK